VPVIALNFCAAAKMRRSTPLRVLCSAPLVGVATASFTLALPVEFVHRTYDLVPLVVAARLDTVCARLSISPGRTVLVVGGFALGYAGRRSLSWFRRRSIARLLQYQGWVHGQTWKVKVFLSYLALFMAYWEHL